MNQYKLKQIQNYVKMGIKPDNQLILKFIEIKSELDLDDDLTRTLLFDANLPFFSNMKTNSNTINKSIHEKKQTINKQISIISESSKISDNVLKNVIKKFL